MGRRRGKKRGGNRSGKGKAGSGDQICLHGEGSFAIGASNNVVTMAIAGGTSFLTVFTRLVQACEMYQLYRFVSLRVTMFPLNGATEGMGALGYVGGQVTAPTTLLQISEFKPSMLYCFGNQTQTGMVSPKTLHVSRRVLLTEAPNKWWRTQASASLEAWEENQGTFYGFLPGTTQSQTYHVSYSVEFCSPVPAGVVPRDLFSKEAKEEIIELIRSNISSLLAPKKLT